MGDRTPAAGPARLTERDLAAIEQRARNAWSLQIDHPDWEILTDVGQALLDVPALLVALRAAWAENARYRAALEHYADHRNWTVGRTLSKYAWVYTASGVRADEIAAAALAAPGAGEETT